MVTIEEKLCQKGKTVIVTGGYRGIGLGIVENFAAAGADIAICGRNAEAAAPVVKKLQDQGVNIRFYQADVRDVDSIRKFVADVEKDFGHIDILVNNAGLTDHVAAEEITSELFDNLFATNVKGAFFMSTEVAKHMFKKNIKGNIVTVSSMSAYVVNIPQKQLTYNMSKAALCAMTMGLAVEWASRGIRVNAICPGYIETEMLVPELADVWTSMTPMGHFGTPDDVGKAVLFLASDASAYMTGSRVIMDGGYSCL